MCVCFGGQAEEAWRKEVGALPTKEWMILTRTPRVPSDASWVAGLSACLPDRGGFTPMKTHLSTLQHWEPAPVALPAEAVRAACVGRQLAAALPNLNSGSRLDSGSIPYHRPGSAPRICVNTERKSHSHRASANLRRSTTHAPLKPQHARVLHQTMWTVTLHTYHDVAMPVFCSFNHVAGALPCATLAPH